MGSQPTVKLFLVDDHPLFRQGVQYALASEGDIQVVGQAASAEEALAWLDQTTANREPDVVLADINLPGINGLDFTRQLRRQYPSIGVIILSIHQSDDQVFHALKAGAADYRSKDVLPADLAAAIRRVARGEFVINDMVLEDPRVASRVLSQFRSQSVPADVQTVADADFLFPPPSERELEVLERIARGGSNREIAEELGISTQTVKNHISSILRKLSLSDRTQAVLYALRRGWISPHDEVRTTDSHPDAEH